MDEVCPGRAGRREQASLQAGNIPERVSIIHSIGRPSLTADRYSPSSDELTTMTVLTTPNWPTDWRGRTDHSIGNTLRIPYSVPLPTQDGDTAPILRRTAWVLSWLVHYPFATVKAPNTPQVERP